MTTERNKFFISGQILLNIASKTATDWDDLVEKGN